MCYIELYSWIQLHYKHDTETSECMCICVREPLHAFSSSFVPILFPMSFLILSFVVGYFIVCPSPVLPSIPHRFCIHKIIWTTIKRMWTRQKFRVFWPILVGLFGCLSQYTLYMLYTISRNRIGISGRFGLVPYVCVCVRVHLLCLCSNIVSIGASKRPRAIVSTIVIHTRGFSVYRDRIKRTNNVSFIYTDT